MITNKREQIFHAVLEIIKENGFNSNIKISDIADRANIGKGTIYEYFSTKDEVLTETILYFLESYKEIIFQYNLSDNFLRELENLINRIIDMNIHIFNTFAYKDISNLLNKDFQIKINKKSKELSVQYFNYFQTIVQKGINENIISKNCTTFEINTVIQTLYVTCSDFVRQSQENEDINKEMFVNQLIKMIVKMLS